jgi:hypothetical protein
MPPTSSSRGSRGTIILPGKVNVFYKIEIDANDGITYTVLNSYSGSDDSNYVFNATISGVATEQLGSFKINMSNINGQFLNVFNCGDNVRFYADVTDATTLIFMGKIDNVNYGLSDSQGYYITLDGRDYPEMIDKVITGQFSSASPLDSLAQILLVYFPSILLSFWNGSSWSIATCNPINHIVTWDITPTNLPTSLVNISFQDKKAFNIITDICQRTGIDCYIEYSTDWKLRVFNEGSISNIYAGIAQGVNLVSMSDFGIDNGEIKNRVKVYGKKESTNIIIVKTSENTASQTDTWIKDLVINDSDCINMTQIGEKADSELSKNSITTASGKLTAIGLYKVKPGDLIPCSIPYCGINGYYGVKEFTHEIGNTFETTVTLSKKIKGIKDIFKEKYNPDDILNIENLNDMKDSYTVFFNEPVQLVALTNTIIENEQLKLASGQTTGYAQATILNTGYNVTECEFRTYNNGFIDLDGYEVSNNGGTTWEVYTMSGNIHTFTSVGSSLTFRITLNRASVGDTSPAYESVCLLYK